jgi:ankyrin repeat protein
MVAFGLGQSQESGQPIEPSTPWVAAADGNLELLQSSLAQLGLTCSATDENGYTLLMAAASYNHAHIMEWLFRANVDVNAVDHDGDTALHHAECVEAAKMLVEAGKASISLANASGLTSLDAKIKEMEDLTEDDEDDDDALQLKELVSYLRSIL